MPRYTKQAAKEIGVSEATLKRWLLKGKVEDVTRDRNGWRVFRDNDVARIRAYASRVGEPESSYAPLFKQELDEPCNYKLASFFTGIGGFDLGFQQAGFQVAFQCEVEPFCVSILEKHWPGIPHWPDITTLNHANVPISDVWVGGFPCQDLFSCENG